MIVSVLWFVFQVPKVQTFAAQRVANYLSEDLEVPVTVESLNIDFWEQVILKGLYVADLNADTLIYVSELNVAVEHLDFLEKEIGVSVELKNPTIKTYLLQGEEVYNHQFIADYFTGNKESKDPGEWEFELSQVELSNAKYGFHNYNKPETQNGVDYFHIEVTNLNLLANTIDFKEDTVDFLLKELSLSDHSGFRLDQLVGDVKVYPGVVALEEMHIKTNKTDIRGKYSMSATQFADFVKYNELVEMEGDLNASLVYISDLAFFVPQLKGIDNYVYLDGKVAGTVNNLRANDLELIINKESFLKGDFSFRGLPDFQNTFIYAELEELRTTANGLRQIPVLPFIEGKTLAVPNFFDQLGYIGFRGNFTGYVSDFVSFGKFETALGKIETDLLLKQNIKGEYEYDGQVSSPFFQLGELLDAKDVGGVGIDVSVKGKGFSKEAANFKAEGLINLVEYRDYRYKGIQLNGAFNKEEFTGEFAIKDPNIIADFNGSINVNTTTPVSKFKLEVGKANLARLNLFNQKDSLTTLSFQSEIDLHGTDIDYFDGIARIKNLTYSDRRLSHKIDQFILIAGKENDVRKIELKSSFVDAKIAGNYKVKELPKAFENFYHQYLIDSNYVSKVVQNQQFELIAQFKKLAPITEVLYPVLVLDSGATLNSSFDAVNSVLSLKFEGNSIQFKESKVDDFVLTVNSDIDSVNLNFVSSQLNIGDLRSVNQIEVSSNLKNNLNNNTFSWNSWGSKISQGQFNISNRIESLQRMNLVFENSFFEVNDAVWNILNGNTIVLDSGRLDIQNLTVGNQSQQFKISGQASASQEDTLSIDLENIDLDFVSSLLPENTVALEGVANGNSNVVAVYDDFSLITNLKLDSLFINAVEIGESNVKSIWNSETNSLQVEGNLGDKESDILKVSGNVYPLNKENSLDLSLDFNLFPLELIRPYLVDYLTDIEGSLNGKVAVNGIAEAPELKGVLGLNKTKFHINYLNTSYSVDDQIIIEPEYIGFNLIEVRDSKGSPAIATGTVFHENYTDFNYDIGLEFTDFISLNTTSKDNDLFYGRGITSGSANISGYSDQLILELDLKTEKGTDFKIPLEGGADVASSDFLVFTNSPDYNKETEQKVDLSGIQLNFDLEITPDAKVQIIFDEQVGDIIKAQGKGDIKMEINTIGDFNIYGQYLVEKGDYLFTLQNIINKRFDIAEGSSIYWDGDPYEAVLDMTAVYKLRAPLYDLFPNDSTDEYKRRTPIELELKLTDYLLKPGINFDIQLPSATEAAKDQLESVLYVNNSDVNPQEMNQQVFGLLVLNRFLPSASAGTATTGGYSAGSQSLSNGYEFVSNQLSNWASQLSDKYDFGVNYQPADELNSNQFDVSVSTQFFKNRLIFDGNVGYTGENPDLQNQNSGFVGEFTAEYKLRKDGRYRVKGFNRSVTNSLLQLNSPYTQGIGLFYREEFDTVGELWRKYFGKTEP